MEHVVGLFEQTHQARDAVEALRAAGFGPDDISVMTADPRGDRVTGGRMAEGSDRESVAGALAGSVLGGIAGWLVGAALMVTPGGQVVVLGALALAGTGAVLGGIGGAGAVALVDAGLSTTDSAWYTEQVKRGSTLVSVRAGARAAEAHEVMRRNGGYGAESRGD